VTIPLSGGSLNNGARRIITNAYNDANDIEGPLEGRKVAAKLLLTTPEFHSTHIISPKSSRRPEYKTPPPSSEPYKAVIFLMLDEGADYHSK
jgi:hypothetical protein